jgi:ABA DEFICIENT 4-like
MSAETLFAVVSAAIVPGWLLLILVPRARITERLVLSGFYSLAFAAVYLVLIVAFFPGARGGFGSLADVDRLFRNPYLLLAGWIHYLAFDLFVGAWEARDAVKRGVPHLNVIPCLVLTFLFGPIGLLAYFGARAIASLRRGPANDAVR